MSGDRLSFLSNQTEDEPAEEIADAAPQQEAPEPPAEPAPTPEADPAQPAPERARDDKGRFAPGQKGETTDGAPPAPDQKALEGRLAAMLDERDKRKQAEEAAAHWRRQFEDLQRQHQPAPQVPDVVQDQQGYQQFIEYEVGRRLDYQEAEFSKVMAIREFGQEAVDAALQAAQSSGAVEHFKRGPNRWSDMVRWHQTSSTLQEIGNPADYRQRVEADLRQRLEAEYAAKYTPAPPPVPPTSLAGAPSTGDKARATPVSAEESFSNAFRRR